MSYSYNPFFMWDESLSMNEPAPLPVPEPVAEFPAEIRDITAFFQDAELPDLDTLLVDLFTPPTAVVIFDIQD